jgi:glutamine amidotransferase
MIAIIDYGMGNLRSVQKALERAGGKDVRITASPKLIETASKIVLPGVGAIKPAIDRLNDLGLAAIIKAQVEAGKPFLGICLGFQLLFETSTEGGAVKGLGILPGTVERFPDTVKVPQMGWNRIRIVQKNCPLYRGIKEGSYVYFCHSYYSKPADPAIVATTTDYGLAYASSVFVRNIWAVQFHPEKSQDVGLCILKNFVDYEQGAGSGDQGYA